jgi:Glycosyl hydrolases family 16
MSFDSTNTEYLHEKIQPTSRVHLARRAPKHAARRSPKHARAVSTRRRLVVPTASFGVAAAAIASLLLSFGGQHAPSDGQTLGTAAKLGLSAPAGRHSGTHRTVHTSVSGSRGGAATVQPLRITETTTTAITHPTSTTTVTTVTRTVVKPTSTTVVKTVTTVTVHPGTPVNPITHPSVPAPTTTTTTVTTTTTTTPTASSNANGPDAPASLGAPTTMVLDDEFNTGSLNTSLWAPTWFANGSVSNNTTMVSSDVSVGANGLALQLNSPSSGGLVSSNPSDGQPGHTGFQIAPTPTQPVFVEFKATLPAAPTGVVANWPALWLDGQTWPEDGEIDVMEGLGGMAAYHIHYGSGSGTAQGGYANSSPGTHTYGVLWTTTGVTFLYDGAVVGTANEAMTSPMYLVMENSYGGSGDPTALPSTMDVRYVKVWN